MTDRQAASLLAFDRFTLDLDDERLTGPGGPIHLGNKAFRVLAALAAEPRRLVTKDQLFETVWDGTIVSESALTSVVKELRRALGDDPKASRFIESVYGRGYRFIADVAPVARTAAAPKPPPSAPPVSLPGPRVPRRALMIGGAGAVAAAVAGIWWTSRSVTASAAKGVAVIPFKPLNGPSQAYFSEGLSQEISVELASDPRLKVITPTSVALAVGKGGGAAEIAQRIGAEYLLSGSVQRQGDALRIICELTDARSGYTVWADRFERRAEDVFDIQREIAGQVAGVVAVQAGHIRREAGGGQGGTASVAAYDAYLKGLSLFEQSSGEAAYKAAAVQLKTALERDPRFARAATWLAMAEATLALFFSPTPALIGSRMTGALRLARQAVALAPALPIAQSILGYVLVVARLDYAAARPFFEKGLRLGAGLAANQSYFASFAAQTGQVEAATQAIERALEIDPLNPARRRGAVQIALLNHAYEPAVTRAADALALDPRSALVHSYLGDALVMLRRFEEARNAYRAEPVELLRMNGLAIAEYHLGNRDAARQWRDRLVAEFGASISYQQAQIHAQWGEPDRAGEALEAAWRATDTGLTILYRDPLMLPLRGHPVYRSLVKRMGFV